MYQEGGDSAETVSYIHVQCFKFVVLLHAHSLKVWCQLWIALSPVTQSPSVTKECYFKLAGTRSDRCGKENLIEQRKDLIMSEVPRLSERHINRDAWTRLNVLPAKIMQV